MAIINGVLSAVKHNFHKFFFFYGIYDNNYVTITSFPKLTGFWEMLNGGGSA
jgi:hypothetical protein